jgi:hypothetical protein
VLQPAIWLVTVVSSLAASPPGSMGLQTTFHWAGALAALRRVSEGVLPPDFAI